MKNFFRNLTFAVIAPALITASPGRKVVAVWTHPSADTFIVTANGVDFPVSPTPEGQLFSATVTCKLPCTVTVVAVAADGTKSDPSNAVTVERK